MDQALIDNYLRYAKPLAKQYNLDPYAMMAVAFHESGLNPNSIGDNGSSFGYHQLHIGGALGNMSPSQARKYLDGYQNLKLAARQMASSGASGLKGRQAIEAIVRNFERPANPGAEINNALSFYNKYSHGTGGDPVSGLVPGTAPLMGNSMQSQDPLAQSRENLMNSLMSMGSGPQTPKQVDAQSQQLIEAISGLRMNQLQAQDAQQGGMGASTGTSMDNMYQGTANTQRFSGSFPTAQRGKLIGSPHQGTHNLGNWQSDNAVDIAVPIGTPIIAVTDGVINSRFGSLGKGGRFAGLRLTVNGKDNSYYYAHLSKYAPGIKPGKHVKRGQVIGYSGEANGVAHLHIGAEYGNPLQIFNLR